MTKEVAIKKKESFWERNKKSNGLLLKKRAKIYESRNMPLS